MKKQVSRGFTLIELLVVVLIIGILAAVAVPQYQKAVVKSHLARLKSIVHGIVVAQENYYLANGKYTKSFDDLDVSLTCKAGSPNNQCLLKGYYCTISNTEQAYVVCWDGEVHLGYQVYYAYSKSTPRNKYCYSSGTDLTTLPHQICKADTGANTATSGRFWKYQ